MRKLGLRMGSSSAQPENIGGFKADGTPGKREGGGRQDAAVATRDARKGEYNPWRVSLPTVVKCQGKIRAGSWNPVLESALWSLGHGLARLSRTDKPWAETGAEAETLLPEPKPSISYLGVQVCPQSQSWGRLRVCKPLPPVVRMTCSKSCGCDEAQFVHTTLSLILSLFLKQNSCFITG